MMNKGLEHKSKKHKKHKKKTKKLQKTRKSKKQKTNQASSITKTRREKGKRETDKGGGGNGVLWCPVPYVWELDLLNSNHI